jgi:hypothetical protein
VLAGVLAFVGALAPGQAAGAASYGSVTAHDGTLRTGCHAYPYHDAVQPPTGEWVLRTTLKDPRGNRGGHGYFLVGGDPRKGRSSFTIPSGQVVLAPAHVRLTRAT